MKKNYNTAGKRALLSFLSAHPDQQFSAEELCLALYGKDSGKKSSVYRQLTALCKDNALRKFHREQDGSALYQYVGADCDCGNHFHEKCLRCGKIEHLDCHASVEFFEHLLKEHGFEVYCGQSVLFGLCASCRREDANRA